MQNTIKLCKILLRTLWRNNTMITHTMPQKDFDFLNSIATMPDIVGKELVDVIVMLNVVSFAESIKTINSYSGANGCFTFTKSPTNVITAAHWNVPTEEIIIEEPMQVVTTTEEGVEADTPILEEINIVVVYDGVSSTYSVQNSFDEINSKVSEVAASRGVSGAYRVMTLVESEDSTDEEYVHFNSTTEIFDGIELVITEKKKPLAGGYFLFA